MTLLEQIAQLEEAAKSEAASVGTEAELEELRIRFLGRKDGRLKAIMRGLGSLSADERPAVGEAANRAKQRITELLDSIRDRLEGPAAAIAADDLTLPGRRRWRGGRHPVTLVIDEICRVLAGLGFARARGPEAETDWYNFVSLNTPLDHPAADMHDTFYLRESILLRSHTSPVQIRTMQTYEPPIRIVAPGMCYRRDPFDASHAPAFEQLEGLAVDEGVSFVDLKATLAQFARGMFGPETKVRFRPSFFPFTEPSAEVDVTCIICGGVGCPVCKGTGWIEIMGAGMVDPQVLRNVGYDADRYTGFAFGMGPARIAMVRYGITDIRLLYEADVRFLEQFA
ncbi:MAG TPA: phenylalanine--tRNA ligase subunit alpha [Longimicrobiales bacterium]|nr:phenylalanine--tRNA ligase subunit alpha [Longimicrobiales bacterium]